MSERGFTYVETLATVALVGLTVLAASSMTAAHPVASARLAAHEDMLVSLDAVIEGIRSGSIEAITGPVALPIDTTTRLSLSIQVEETDRAGLIWVRAQARCSVRGRPLERTLSTAIWRAP